MENETTTMPARLTQPAVLDTDARTEPGVPIFKLIFLVALLAVIAVAYFA